MNDDPPLSRLSTVDHPACTSANRCTTGLSDASDEGSGSSTAMTRAAVGGREPHRDGLLRRRAVARGAQEAGEELLGPQLIHRDHDALGLDHDLVVGVDARFLDHPAHERLEVGAAHGELDLAPHQPVGIGEVGDDVFEAAGVGRELAHELRLFLAVLLVLEDLRDAEDAGEDCGARPRRAPS